MPRKRQSSLTPQQRLAKLPRHPALALAGGLVSLRGTPLDTDEVEDPALILWYDEKAKVVRGATPIDLAKQPDGGAREAQALLITVMTESLPNETGDQAPPLGIPGRVTVTDAALAALLETTLAPLNTKVSLVPELPDLQRAVDEFLRFVTTDEEDELFDWPLAATPLRRLFAAAGAFAAQEPWEVIDEYPPLIVTLGARGPEVDVTALYCTVLGAGGMVRGIAAYFHEEDLERLLEDDTAVAPLLTDARREEIITQLREANVAVDQLPPDIAEQLIAQAALLMGDETVDLSDLGDALACYIVPIDEMDAGYLNWARDHHFLTKASQTLPSFIRVTRDAEPRQPNEREARALTLTLDAVSQFFAWLRSQPESTLRPGETIERAFTISKERDPVTVSYTAEVDEDDADEDDTAELADLTPDHPPSAAATTTLYRFRVAPEFAPDAWRKIELRGDHTPHDLHEAIQAAFDWRRATDYAFFLSGVAWDNDSALLTPAAGTERNAAAVYLAEAFPSVGKKFLYLDDFGAEQGSRVTLEAVLRGGARPDVTYPRVSDGLGEAPRASDET